METYILLIWQIGAIVLILCGAIGNSMSLLVLTRVSLIKLPITPYLITLSIMNTIALCFGLGRYWILYVFNVDIRDVHTSICKLHPWLLYWSLSLSAWMLVGMTIERVVSVYWPCKVRSIFTRRTSYAFIGTVAICLALTYCHFLFGLEMEKNTDGNITTPACKDIHGNYAIFLYNTFPWIDFCLFSLIPVIVQLSGNGMIICKLISSVSGLKKLTVEDTKHRKTQVSSMTAILLTLNFVFLICTTPISIFLIWSGKQSTAGNPPDTETSRLLWVIFNILMYSNNSATFLSLCLSGRTFREQLRSMCVGKTKYSFEMTVISSCG